MNADILSFAAGSLVAAAVSPLAASGRDLVVAVAQRITAPQPRARASTQGKRRRATLTVAPCRKPRGPKESGLAFAGLLECAGHAIWLDDPMVLGVAAYVMNVGTVELSLPTCREENSVVYAHQRQLPEDVVTLNSSTREDEAAEALFARRFITALRVCTQRETHVESLLDWYRSELLTKATKAVPTDLRINVRI